MNPDSTPSSVGLNKDALARLGASIQADIDNGKHFGASILVARHGHVAYQASFGKVAPGRAPSGDDRYLLMSMSKAYTATLVLKA
ncbi:serine hydrolase, partial [Escherichia coli]